MSNLLIFRVPSWMQREVVEETETKVSTRSSNLSTALSHDTKVGTSVRKRLTSPKNKASSAKYSLLQYNKSSSENMHSGSDSEGKMKMHKRKYKVYPFKNRSAEEFRFNRMEYSTRKSSSVDSSDCEFDINAACKKKDVSYTSEEKSQLISFRDNSTKIIAIKNDTKITKYNTFNLKPNERNKLIKYKSLDEPASRTIVKYRDNHSDISIAAHDFDLNFKLAKFGQKHKHDIITSTVDSWAKKDTKTSLLSNLKNSIFKSNSEKSVVFKPLVFGGTFPIDSPLSEGESLSLSRALKSATKSKSENHKMMLNDPPKMRAYGAPKTFDIDRPI